MAKMSKFNQKMTGCNWKYGDFKVTLHFKVLNQYADEFVHCFRKYTHVPFSRRSDKNGGSDLYGLIILSFICRRYPFGALGGV